MIALTPHMRIFVAVDPVDFRKGIDGLIGVCRKTLSKDPFSGHLFVFSNRNHTSLKMLLYDGQGFYLCQKRLSQGRFTWWPDKMHERSEQLSSHEMHQLLWNSDPKKNPAAPIWKAIR